jgi:flagellar biogenesis protein FliO
MESVIVQMVLSLSAVLLVMFAVSAVVKRYIGISADKNANSVNIEILGQKFIQPKRAIYVVKIAKKIFVMSSHEQGMHLLGELDDSDLQKLTVDTVLLSSLKQSIMDSTKSFVTQFPKLNDILHGSDGRDIIIKKQSRTSRKKDTGQG